MRGECIHMGEIDNSVLTKHKFTSNDFLKKYALLTLFVIIYIIYGYFVPSFLTVKNFIAILDQSAILLVLSLGMMTCLLVGGIDLSIGANTSFCLLVAFYIMSGDHLGLGTFWSIVITLAVGGILGFLNSLIIVKAKVMPLIATLAMSFIFSAFGMLFTGGGNIMLSSDIPKSFSFIAQGSVGPIPFPIFIIAIVASLFYLIINNSYVGRFFYCIGSNEKASFLSGIKIKYYTSLAYVICGIAAGLGGVLMASKIGAGQTAAADGYNLEAIAVAFISTSIFQSRPNVFGVVAGAYIISSLDTMLTLVNAEEYVQEIVKGLILIIAVMISVSRSNSKKA